MIDNSSLPIAKKVSLKSRYDSQYRRVLKGNLTAEDRYWIDYEKKQVYADKLLLEEYQNRLSDPDDEITDTEQKKYDKAARRMNQYWTYSSGGAYNPSVTSEENKTETTEAPASSSSSSQENPKEVLKSLVDKYKAQGMSSEDLQTKIEQIAPKYGLDWVELVNEWGI